MDQRTRDVQEDLKQIDRTRAALDEKLQLLDRRIDDTVRETKAATLEVFESAGEKVSHLVETMRHGPIPYLVSRATRQPLALVGGVVALGLLATWIDRRRRSNGGIYPYFPSTIRGADVMPDDGHARTRRGVYPFFPSVESRRLNHRRTTGEPGPGSGRQPRSLLRTVGEDLTEELRHEGVRLREAALCASRSLFRDLAQTAGALLIAQLSRPSGRSRDDHVDRLPEMRRLT